MTVDEDADDEQDVAKGQPTPYEELRALNKLGPTQYKWLIKLVQSVARMNGFPPPSGYVWHDEAAHDWLQRHYFGLLAERYNHWLDTAADWSVPWQDVAGASDYLLKVSPARAAALVADLEAVIERYRVMPPEAEAETTTIHVIGYPTK